MKKQNIWLWALTAAVVLLAAALAETQGQLGELQTAYSALQQEVGELRLDLKAHKTASRSRRRRWNERPPKPPRSRRSRCWSDMS